MMKNIKSLVESLIPSDNNIKEKCLNICNENGIETLDDLLCLNEEEIDSFSFPELFKNKLLEEINKLKSVSFLSEDEIKLIKSFYESDISLDLLISALNIQKGTKKADLVIEYYNSLKKPLKPKPKNIPEFYLETEEKSLPLFEYPSKKLIGKRYYTLVLIGETGSGKTTLLDAFVNYLSGINYEDDWRYKLVNENDKIKRNPGAFYRIRLSPYYINYQRDEGREINIRCIETPGYGDTKGKYDGIIRMFENIFRETGEIDYILLVVKSHSTRCCIGIEYLYNLIKEMFGKDVLERFILICTFCDGQKPIVVETLKNKFVYQDYFVFNNYGLYSSSKNAGINSKFFWKMGNNSIRRFFDIILDKDLPPLSLTLSKPKIDYREWLFAAIDSSKRSINKGFELFEKLITLLHIIKKNEKHLNEKGSFIYEDYEEKTKEIPLDKPIQWCKNCECLCCEKCLWPDGAQFSQCKYFTNGRNCPICPDKCPIEAHIQTKIRYVKEKVKITKIYKTKNYLFKEGQKSLSQSEDAVEKEINNMSNVGKTILINMQELKFYLFELNKIMNIPGVLDNNKFLNEMIECEETEKKFGWEYRVKYLKKMETHVNKIYKEENLNVLFPQYNKILQELKNKIQDKESETNCILF